MWPSIIKILLAAGHSQKAIADKVGVNQSTICRLADGGTEPRWSVGVALIELAGGQTVLVEQHGVDVARYMDSRALTSAVVRDPPLALVDRRVEDRPFAHEDRRAPAGEN